MADTEILLGLYFCGWLVVTLGLYAAGRRLAESDSAAPHLLGVSILGGAVWPLVLVGVVEMSSVVVYTKVQSKPAPKVGILA